MSTQLTNDDRRRAILRYLAADLLRCSRFPSGVDFSSRDYRRIHQGMLTGEIELLESLPRYWRVIIDDDSHFSFWIETDGTITARYADGGGGGDVEFLLPDDRQVLAGEEWSDLHHKYCDDTTQETA